MENKYNLVILHYDSGTVEYDNVPEEYKDDAEKYLFEIKKLLEGNIMWMYTINEEIITIKN